IGQTVGSNSTNYFSAPDDIRYKELQEFLDNPHIRAIYMGRGGYGMSRIIDQLNFDQFKKSPKWICGFSDITLLHNHLQHAIQCASLHSPMCAAFIPKTDFDNRPIINHIYNALFGHPMSPIPI